MNQETHINITQPKSPLLCAHHGQGRPKKMSPTKKNYIRQGTPFTIHSHHNYQDTAPNKGFYIQQPFPSSGSSISSLDLPIPSNDINKTTPKTPETSTIHHWLTSSSPGIPHTTGVFIASPPPLLYYKTSSQDSIKKLSHLTMTPEEAENIRFLCNSTPQEDLEEDVGNIL